MVKPRKPRPKPQTRIVSDEERDKRRVLVAAMRFEQCLSYADIAKGLLKKGIKAAISTIQNDVERARVALKNDFERQFDATEAVARVVARFEAIEEQAVRMAQKGQPGSRLHALRVAGFAAQAKFDVLRETRLIPDELALGNRDRRPDERLPNAKEIMVWAERARVLDAQLIPPAERDGDYGSELDETPQRLIEAGTKTDASTEAATGTEDGTPGTRARPTRRIRAV